MKLLEIVWKKICHDYRESNYCNDALANLGYDLCDARNILDTFPTLARHFLYAGVATSRLIFYNFFFELRLLFYFKK